MENITAPFTVCTFNVRYGTAPDGENAWPHRRDLLLDIIERLAPDILATQETLPFQLQEIQHRFSTWNFVGEGRFKGVSSGRTEESGAGEHCAIFFRADRFQLVDTWTRWLCETPEQAGCRGWGAHFPRVVTLARLKCMDSGHKFDIFNTHFDWGSVFTHNSISLLQQWFAETPKQASIVLMGDFNVDAGGAEYHALTVEGRDRYLRDVFDSQDKAHATRHNFTGVGTERIDWILASSDIPILRAWTDTSCDQGRYPSDHFPVLAQFGVSSAKS